MRGRVTRNDEPPNPSGPGVVRFVAEGVVA
jgi:hypothetical protein